MNLRPISFFVPSTTEIKIYFSLELSESLTADNFSIESISGSGSDLEVVSVSISSNLITLTTRPQVPSNYYLLKLKDSILQSFVSSKGISLINDSVSREIFFLGVENVNRIRDDMVSKLPQLYNVEGTTIYNIMSNVAEEILDAQHDIGSVLNSNYLKIPVIEEPRTRGVGAYDRLANENAYEVLSVSKFRASDSLFAAEVSIDAASTYPFNLREAFVDSEEISLDSKGNSFSGFLLSLSKKYITRVSSIKVIKNTDEENCSGEIGAFYNIKKYKYSILSNRYDQNNSFSNITLNSNNVLLSDFGNIERLEPKDKIIISYYYEDKSKNIDLTTLSVYSKISILNESIPSNSTNFYLENSPIINSSGETSTYGGVKFKINENIETTPDEFNKELEFNFSKLPKSLGEYTINYETGEVILVGSNEIGEGTGFNYYYSDYIYKKIYTKDLDYFVYNNEINFKSNRSIIGKNLYITYSYNSIFSEGEDYNPYVHKEVMSEAVENKYTSTFSFKTKNSPITDVFRVLNQTTGEVYSTLYYNDNEVFISGRNLPRFEIKADEPSNFEVISNESLTAAGELISPMHVAVVTGNSSTNAITINPPIPSEFIDSESTYYLRINEGSSEDISTDDKLISYFHASDVNGNISSLAISSNDVVPSIGQTVFIGIKTYVFNLSENIILNKENDGVGSFLSSSVAFTKKDLFLEEKYFKKINSNNTISETSSGSIYYTVSNTDTDVLFNNLTKIRKNGDFLVDYHNGVIYLGVSSDESYYAGEVSYYHSSHICQKSNILSSDFVAKKEKFLDQKEFSQKIYESFGKENNKIKILDLESSLNIYDGELASSTFGEEKEALIVLEDYTALTIKNIKSINSINLLPDLVGSNLDSIYSYNRSVEKKSDKLLKTISNGGFNYFNSKYVSFDKNIIDFKKKFKYKLSLGGDYFTILFKDNLISTIYNIVDSNTEEELMDVRYNITLKTDISVLSSQDLVDYLKITFDHIDSEYVFSDNYDYIIDSNYNVFKIIEYSYDESYILINKYSENNPESSFDEELFSLISKPLINIDSENVSIIVPLNFKTKLYSELLVNYLTSYTPDVGLALAIDYHYGLIYFDYTYILDDLYVWYEYGDNQVDWSINNSIYEGDRYYVTYNYGALRSALRKNFGSITSIPKLQNFSLNVERETYRDFLIGVLQSYPKGPTLPSISNLVSSVTKTAPDISESFFGNWILGRDYLKTSTVDYAGKLVFEEARFKQGLNILDENVLTIPAVSNLSLNEGTIETWIKPNWNGINNDANITFQFENVGENIYTYIGGEDPFSIKYKFEVSSDTYGTNYGTDYTGGSLTIFKNIEDGDGYTEQDKDGSFSVYHNKSSISRVIKTTLSLDIKQNYLNVGYLSPYLSLGEINFLGGAYINIGDNFKDLFVSFGYKSFKETPVIFSDASINTDTLLDFGFPYQTRLCNCSVIDQRDTLEKFTELSFEITFEENLKIEDIIYTDSIITDSPDSLAIVDNNGYIYHIKYLFDHNNIKFDKKIPNLISKIIVNRFPENYQSLSSKTAEEINNVSFSSFIILNKILKIRNFNVNKELDSSYIIFQSPNDCLINWSIFNKIKIERDPISNLIHINLGSKKFNYFYTDLLESDEVHNLFFPSLPRDKVSVGVTNISSTDIKNFRLNINNKFNLDDIYIGSYGYHPTRSNFVLNRFDDKNNNTGISYLVDIKEGIYIGYDPNCISPVDDQVGQWVIKVRNDKFISLPNSVKIDGDTYNNVDELFEIKIPVIGLIKTDGEFSSVSRGRRLVSNDCGNDSKNCNGMYRYCSELLLEDGWIRYSDTDSEKINQFGGRQQEVIPWSKVGSFESTLELNSYRMELASLSDDERINNFGYGLFTEHSCNKGFNSLVVNMKVNNFDYEIINNNQNKINSSFYYTGISPIIFSSDNYIFSVCFAVDSSGQGVVTLVDHGTGVEISSTSFAWNDFAYHAYLLEINEESIKLFIDNSLYIIIDPASLSLNNYDSCDLPIKNFIGTLLINNLVVNSNSLIENYNLTNLNLNLIELTYLYDNGKLKLEEDDIFIQENDNTISFSLVGGVYEDIYEVDGYAQLSDLDEIFITSDKLRYIVDTGLSNSNSRLSIFKDGKGFLNFRVYDRRMGDENTLFNLATSIKHFLSGELHHIAASWKFNSHNESDEMHLFLDGQEAPNIYKFGGKIPLKINSKFADISQETLQDHLRKNIEYHPVIENAAIIAGDNKLYSDSIIGNEDIISRGIIIKASTLADSIVGNYYTIIGLGEGYLELGDPNSFNPVLFNVSASDVGYSFPPSCGNLYQIKTDIYNDRFAISIKDCDQNVVQVGGKETGVIDNSIYLSSGMVSESSFRYNSTLRLIEFIKYDLDTCSWVESVNKTDLDVSIITFGLKTRKLNQIISVPSSSLHTSVSNDLSFYLNKAEEISLLQTSGPKPRDILDVEITKIIIKDALINESYILDDLFLYADFEIFNSEEIGLLTSEFISKPKNNDGRYLSVIFDSDNIEFCGTDGYSEEINYIDLYGENTSGEEFERIYINGNGKFSSTNRFYHLDKVIGNFKVIDDLYEVCKFSIEETSKITVLDGNGDYASIERFVDGYFVIGYANSTEYDAFELPPGYYRVEYPSSLKIDLPIVGNKLYLGSSFEKKNQLNGVLDDFVIRNEMLLDLKSYEDSSSSTNTVTYNYNKNFEACLSSNVLSLINFDDPLDYQARVLRTYKFLDENNNIKYSLDINERENLIQYINDKTKFISEMINMGYSEDESLKLYISCHMANNGPIKNLAEFYPLFEDVSISNSSVNSYFNSCGKFSNNKYSLFNNNTILKNDYGQIEFWVSPMIDTKYDFNNRYYFDAYSAQRLSTKSISSSIINLNNPASKILSIKLLKNTQEFSGFIPNSTSEVLFDEITRSEITGKLEGGTGTDKDFSLGSKLSPDGTKIVLNDVLPGSKIDVVVTYIPKQFSGQRVSIFKDRFSRIIFRIISDNKEYFVAQEVDWDSSSWHRINCSYTCNNKSDFMRMIIDGNSTEDVYARNSEFNQDLDYNFDELTPLSKIKIKLNEEFSQLTIGNNLFEDLTAKSRIDNFRISKSVRKIYRDSSGKILDPSYSSNLESIYPVKEDDLTTLLLDFDSKKEQLDFFATIIDEINGTYSFDIDIYDDFNKLVGINDGSLEDLMVELINRIKPAHTNSVIRFNQKYCKD